MTYRKGSVDKASKPSRMRQRFVRTARMNLCARTAARAIHDAISEFRKHFLRTLNESSAELLRNLNTNYDLYVSSAGKDTYIYRTMRRFR